MTRPLSETLEEIDATTGRHDLSDTVAEPAAVIARRAIDAGLDNEYDSETLATAAVYAACVEEDADVMLSTIGTDARAARAYHQLVDQLDLRSGTIPEAETFVLQFASALGVSTAVLDDALEILSNVDKSDHTGNQPAGIAAGALYAADHKRDGETVITKNLLSDVAVVSTTTVTNRGRELISNTMDEE